MNKSTSLTCRKILLILLSMLLVYSCLGKSGTSLEISSAPVENKPFNFIPYEDPPEPINPKFPEYPPELIKTVIEGMVYLEVEVFKDGSVGKIKVLKSLHKEPGGLDEAAVTAVKKWKFKPQKNGGKPIDTFVIIPIEFKITFEEYETPPMVVKSVEPLYPDMKPVVFGFVYLEVEVLKTGQIKDIQVLKSLMPGPGGLDKAAIKAVRQWEFKPGLNKAGKEINTRVIVPVEFTPETKRKSR